MQTSDIIQIEDRYQIPTYNKFPIALAKGKGAYVWDTDDRKYIDFYGGHCVTILGHCPEQVVTAIKEQTRDILFYSNVVYSPVRAKAAHLLASVAPETFQQVYFCNSGTEANETALKLARTYTGKDKIVAMQHGFHGRTLGSLAATGIEKYRAPYIPILPPCDFIDFGSFESIENTFQRNRDIAAIILEPIQSMAGIIEADISFYQKLRSLCDTHEITLIFDEVQTGVGRTGTFSISDQYGIKPDLITMAKSLGSGLPVGAVFVSDRIASDVKPGDHGSTFGGGMISMAAVIATVETIVKDDLMKRASAIYDFIEQSLASHVKEVRGRGCLIGIECDEPVKPLIDSLRDAGVLVGSSMHPHTIRLMPPVNTPQNCLEQFVDIFKHAVATLEIA